MRSNQLIFTILTEENSSTLDIVLQEVIRIRHPVLTSTSKSHAAIANKPSSSSSLSIARSSIVTTHELLTRIKHHFLSICRLILKNLTISVEERTNYHDLAPLLQVELMQMSQMIQETATVDHMIETTNLKCHQSFRDYLHSLKMHLHDYLIPHKNSFDRNSTYEFLIRAQLVDVDKKMATTAKLLQVCPRREEAKKRTDKYKEMQNQISTLVEKIQQANDRLSQFRRLNPRLIEKLTQVHDELTEKRWLADQLGCLSFAESSALES